MSINWKDVPRSFLPLGSFDSSPNMLDDDSILCSQAAFARSSLASSQNLSSSLFVKDFYPQLQKELVKLSLSSSGIGSPDTPPLVDRSHIVVCKHKAFNGPKILRLNEKIIIEKEVAEICFANMQNIDIFCRNVFQKPPVENVTKAMISELKNPSFKNNATWVPARELVEIGKTDPNIFTREFAEDEDILSHEFGHAMIQYRGGFQYINQSGALNESLADVFAIMRNHYSNDQNANDPNTSWILGEGIFKDTSNIGLRSFKNPGLAYYISPSRRDLQVDNMTSLKTCKIDEDNGGVHINSGIPNHAFYLAATNAQGRSWEKIGKIWFKALDECITQSDYVTFSGFAQKTLTIAKRDFDGNIENIVGQAWTSVGVDLKGFPKFREGVVEL